MCGIRSRSASLAILLLVSLLACTRTGETIGYIEVFAGSASKPALDEIALQFERETGVTVRRVYGGSGSVMSSMLMSGRGDVYVPGSHDFMDKAIGHGLVDEDTIRIIAYLAPVIAVRKGNPKNIRSLDDLLRPDVSFSIGNPATVCVGLYAVEVFDAAGIAVPLRRKVATYAENCEKTATLVSLGAVDAVIGWDAFAHWNRAGIDVIAIDRRHLKRAAYIPAAVVKTAQNRKMARRFLDFLASERGKRFYRKAGYMVTAAEVRERYGAVATGGRYGLHAAWR